MILCQRFPTLTPFAIREQRANEVFMLVKRLGEYDKKQKVPLIPEKIRRKAGDNWF